MQWGRGALLDAATKRAEKLRAKAPAPISKSLMTDSRKYQQHLSKRWKHWLGIEAAVCTSFSDFNKARR